MAKKSDNAIGSWAFLIGLVIAIIIALLGTPSQGLLITLVVLGLVIGLLNIAENEATPFLLSGVSLVIVSSMGGSVLDAVPYVGDMLSALLVLFVPATIVVAIRNVFTLARR